MKYKVATSCLALIIGAFTASCSNDEHTADEHRVEERRLQLPNNVVLEAMNSRSWDTIRAGEVFSAKIYMNHSVLSDIARARNIKRPIKVFYSPIGGLTTKDTAVMIGDTGVVEFTPVVRNLKKGEVRKYGWSYKLTVDFLTQHSGVDTTFMVNDALFIQAKP